MPEEHPFSILHRLNLINCLVIIIPILTIIISYTVYFKGPTLRYIPYITELTLLPVAGRVSSVGVSALSIIVIFVMYIRGKEITVIRRGLTRIPERRYKVTRLIMIISGYTFCITNLLAVFFPYKFFPTFSIVLTNFSYIAFNFYAFTGDMVFKMIGYPTKRFSRIQTMIVFTLTLLFLILRYIIPNYSGDALRMTSGNFFGLVAFISVYIKLFITMYDVPKCGIRISKKINVQ